MMQITIPTPNRKIKLSTPSSAFQDPRHWPTFTPGSCIAAATPPALWLCMMFPSNVSGLATSHKDSPVLGPVGLHSSLNANATFAERLSLTT